MKQDKIFHLPNVTGFDQIKIRERSPGSFSDLMFIQQSNNNICIHISNTTIEVSKNSKYYWLNGFISLEQYKKNNMK